MTSVEAELMREIIALRRRLEKMEAGEPGGYVPLTTALTSTSWDGDARSTTAKTLIDLSAVFGVPARARAVYVRLSARDSASAANSGIYVGLSANDTADSFSVAVSPRGLPNDYYAEQDGIVSCDANGDIYFQVAASGAGTMDVDLKICGYWM